MASVQGLPSNRATQREGVSKRNRTKTTQTLTWGTGGEVAKLGNYNNGVNKPKLGCVFIWIFLLL